AEWEGDIDDFPAESENDGEPPTERAKIEQRLGVDLAAKNTIAELENKPIDRGWLGELICQKTKMSPDEFMTWRKKYKEENKKWPTIRDFAAKQGMNSDKLFKDLFGDLLQQQGSIKAWAESPLTLTAELFDKLTLDTVINEVNQKAGRGLPMLTKDN